MGGKKGQVKEVREVLGREDPPHECLCAGITAAVKFIGDLVDSFDVADLVGGGNLESDLAANDLLKPLRHRIAVCADDFVEGIIADEHGLAHRSIKLDGGNLQFEGASAVG